MDGIGNKENSDVEKELYIDGHKLTIKTCYEQDFGWSLSVVNEKGVSSNWQEFFPSAHDAIEAALKVINEEGIDEFMGYDGFGYLYEDKNP